MKIGIIYFVTGDYCTFWEDFYDACEKFFCIDATKTYYLFTENETLLTINRPNVQTYRITDRGWIINVSSKNEYMISIKDQLEENQYAFYLNGNYKPINKIYSNELIPCEKEHFLVGLSFHVFKNKRPSLLPYERNESSLAYIPYGLGHTYFQGGFYGGRIKELLELAHWCNQCYQTDSTNGIITCNHDESYLNHYFINHPPKIIGTELGKPEEWSEPTYYKAIFIDKDNLKWMKKTVHEKVILLNPSLHYLLNKSGKARSVNIINLFGGLGNQMFQYAFYLNTKLRNISAESTFANIYPLDHTNSQRITDIFNLNHLEESNDSLKQEISHTEAKYILTINEKADSDFQKFEDNSFPIVQYTGYWQTEKYFKPIERIIRKEYIFNKELLNYKSKSMLIQIENHSSNSVSIHIRRGDYENEPTTKQKHGNICTLLYYQKAIEYMKSVIGNSCPFYLFSDDPVWARDNFQLQNCEIIDWNTVNNSWQDLLLMSACAHHIIANSSFSWWGAWLNNSPNKIVIAPKRWLNNTETPDILLEEWIKL